MPTREEFLRIVWEQVIDAPVTGAWIDSAVAEAQARPDGPFADAGQALARLLASGAGHRDVGLVVRAAVYEAVFSLLYMLNDPGVDGNEVFMLHESLLSADPSGREGRQAATGATADGD